MAVITLSITESSTQVIAGIPTSITISTNIPASIFYTLDGSIPTLFSSIYMGPISLPIDVLSVTLNVFASNGTDSSPIITELYTTNILNNTRLPHSTTNLPIGSNKDLYPFGTNIDQSLAQFENPADGGVTVDNPELPQFSIGYGSDGYANSFTNKPYNSQNYDIKYSVTDAEGRRGPLIGNLPANVKIETPPPPSEETDQFSNLFDPRALVIYQDYSKEDPTGPVSVNKQYFILENIEKAKDGNYFYSSGLDAPPVNGSFVRSEYNPRDNTITYYYLDTWSNRWIISKTPYKPTGHYDGNLSQIATGRDSGGIGRVYEWLPYTRRILF